MIGLDEPLRADVLGNRTGGFSPVTDRVDAITLHHLLGHTSGLPDYAEQPDGKYVQTILGDPMREWKPEGQIAFALDHYTSTGPPGKQFAYSDTGYLVVGQLIERVTGQPLPQAVRRLADYSRAGLADTYRTRSVPDHRPLWGRRTSLIDAGHHALLPLPRRLTPRAMGTELIGAST